MEKNLKDFYTGVIWKDYKEQEIKDLIAQDKTVLYVPEEVYKQNIDVFTILIFSTSKKLEKLKIM